MNVLSPQDLLVLGTRRVEALEERRPDERDGLWKLSKDEMYCGEENFNCATNLQNIRVGSQPLSFEWLVPRIIY